MGTRHYNYFDPTRVPTYYLEGHGSFVIQDSGKYHVALDDIVIYDVVHERKGNKGALSLEYTNPRTLDEIVEFEMTIN